MISSERRFIYIHYPKTGGNTIQSVLLPFSDDQRKVELHQDGVDRFEVSGHVTPEKHASLQDYHDILGPEMDGYRIAISIRHPFERIISAYFSPHKWLEEDENGQFQPLEPYWDPIRFNILLQIKYQRPAVEYLRVDGTVRQPDFILRYETFRDSLVTFGTAVDLPASALERIPHVNASVGTLRMRAELLSDRALRDRVEAIYADDMAFFGYDSYPIPG